MKVNFAFVPTKAVLVRKSRRTFGTHKPKAPSGRELPTKSGEGECVTMKFNLNFRRGLLPSRSACHRLAAARSCSGSDTTPWCHSLPLRRFATSRRKAMLPPDSASKKCNTLYLGGKACEKRTENFHVLCPFVVGAIHESPD